MPELAAFDVEQYTQGRLAEGDPETVRLLAAGLAAARRFCGWHVAPSSSTTVTLDGPGGRILALPTLKLSLLTSITEDGSAIAPADVFWSPRGMLQKKSGAYWSCNFGSIVVVMTHGFDDAADFNAAVLSWIDRSSLASAGGRARVIGPFQYDTEAMAAGSAFSEIERSLLEQYRLEAPA